MAEHLVKRLEALGFNVTLIPRLHCLPRSTTPATFLKITPDHPHRIPNVFSLNGNVRGSGTPAPYGLGSDRGTQIV